jgi:hypothetical protein
MNWLLRVFGGRATESKTFTTRRDGIDMLVVRRPSIGFLNLIGEAAEPIVAEDKQVLEPLFTSCHASSSESPVCDVLMIYCDIERDGRIRGTSDGLRDIIRRAQALVVITASENRQESLTVAGKDLGYGRANLVLTFSRNGGAFVKFFRQLFQMMLNGAPMPMAWVSLAPQIPGEDHRDLPGSFFVCEAGQIVFE